MCVLPGSPQVAKTRQSKTTKCGEAVPASEWWWVDHTVGDLSTDTDGPLSKVLDSLHISSWAYRLHKHHIINPVWQKISFFFFLPYSSKAMVLKVWSTHSLQQNHPKVFVKEDFWVPLRSLSGSLGMWPGRHILFIYLLSATMEACGSSRARIKPTSQL